MATIKEIIERVDDCKPNAFTWATKTAWIAELDGMLGLNVFLMSTVEARQLQYKYPADMDTEPIVEFPHDGIYDAWLSAKIDYENGEYDKYQNAMENYNARYEDFVRWFARTYDPAQGYRSGWTSSDAEPPYYITAYGMAVKRGFQGSLDEWIASLKGEPAKLLGSETVYQAGESCKDEPTGDWTADVPEVAQGGYLWTRVTKWFDSGEPVISYSVCRMGIDGRGSLATINGFLPDPDGNIDLTAEKVGARPNTWMPTAQEVGARPSTWMPTAQEVGARPNTWMPTAQEVGARPSTWVPDAGEITGTLPVSHGGTGGKTASEARTNLGLDNTVDAVVTYYASATAMSADDLTVPTALIPVSASVNPDLYRLLAGSYAYVLTIFYGSRSTTSRRTQIALPYNSTYGGMASRSYGSNGWTDWQRITANILTSLEYGDTLPATGVKGQIYFKKVT